MVLLRFSLHFIPLDTTDSNDSGSTSLLKKQIFSGKIAQFTIYTKTWMDQLLTNNGAAASGGQRHDRLHQGLRSIRKVLELKHTGRSE